MLEDLDSVPWATYPRDDGKDGFVVPDAIRALSQATGREGSLCSEVLIALGNNHRGTYYPAVVPALSFIAEILRFGGASAQRAALAVIDDLAFFHPHDEADVICEPDGQKLSIRVAFRAAMGRLRPNVEALAASPDGAFARFAAEVLGSIGSLLDDGGATPPN